MDLHIYDGANISKSRQDLIFGLFQMNDQYGGVSVRSHHPGHVINVANGAAKGITCEC